MVEQKNNHHKQHKSKHEELAEEQREIFEYSHHDNEPPQASCGSSRTSVSSSPSHEFSFTVCSLYTSPTSTADKNAFRESLTNSSTSSAAATAIDLSPADEIFLHGHLLPLHLLSGGHLSISPRSSTNSLDGFTLPITSLSNSSNADSSSLDQDAQDRALDNNMEKPKSRSFSLFRNRITSSKSRKLPQNQDMAENKSSKSCQDNDNPNHHYHKNLNKVKFDLSNAIKQYAKLVRPLLTFKQGNSTSNNSRRESGIQLSGQTFSYSGNLSHRRSSKQGADEVLRGRFSAPASMRTSPANSGMFLEPFGSNNSSSSNDSTMEELQAAIQAAIAHCKNSSIAAAAVQDKI